MPVTEQPQAGSGANAIDCRESDCRSGMVWILTPRVLYKPVERRRHVIQLASQLSSQMLYNSCYHRQDSLLNFAMIEIASCQRIVQAIITENI
jgi:hypothetical protein